mmetsp:Transcript_89020/g.252388  ORF Transcript_89020/g.252388 Transcript_89020/m.252388 type:complete len:334 (+) Transcript_89020:900-1901(+)
MPQAAPGVNPAVLEARLRVRPPRGGHGARRHHRLERGHGLHRLRPRLAPQPRVARDHLLAVPQRGAGGVPRELAEAPEAHLRELLGGALGGRDGLALQARRAAPRQGLEDLHALGQHHRLRVGGGQRHCRHAPAGPGHPPRAQQRLRPGGPGAHPPGPREDGRGGVHLQRPPRLRQLDQAPRARARLGLRDAGALQRVRGAAQRDEHEPLRPAPVGLRGGPRRRGRRAQLPRRHGARGGLRRDRHRVPVLGARHLAPAVGPQPEEEGGAALVEPGRLRHRRRNAGPQGLALARREDQEHLAAAEAEDVRALAEGRRPRPRGQRRRRERRRGRR